MYRNFLAALAFLMSATFVGVPAARAAAPALVAADRCNSRMINEYATQVRDWDAHPPRGNLGDLEKRFNDINQLLQALNQERGIVDSLCSDDVAKAPLFAYIGATASYALALESDVALRINQPCPPAAKAVAEALLAQGWLDLGSVVNDAGGNPPHDVTEAAPRLQTRAAALEMKLPAWGETSAYWRDQVSNQAKAAIEACSTPLPSSSP
jgi:hypothetical protein